MAMEVETKRAKSCSGKREQRDWTNQRTNKWRRRKWIEREKIAPTIVAMKLFLNLFIVKIRGCKKEGGKNLHSIDFNCISTIIIVRWSFSWNSIMKDCVALVATAAATFICWPYKRYSITSRVFFSSNDGFFSLYHIVWQRSQLT